MELGEVTRVHLRGRGQQVAHVVGDGVHPHPVDLAGVLEQRGVRPRQPPRDLGVVVGAGLVHELVGHVQVGIGGAAQEDVEVEVARTGTGPLDVEEGGDATLVPQDVLEGDVTVDQRVGLERDEGGGQVGDQLDGVREHHGVDVLELHRPAQRGHHRDGGVGGTYLEQLRSVLDRRQVGRRWSAVQRGEPDRQVVDGSIAVGVGEMRPDVRERLARHPLRDEPVLTAATAVGDHRRVPDLGRQGRRDEGLAVEAVAGPAVDAHRVVRREPDLVGDAADPLDRDAGIKPGAAEGCPGPYLGQRCPRLALCSRSHGSTERTVGPHPGPWVGRT